MSSTFYLLLVVLLCDCLASGFRITGPLVAANLSPDRLPQRREINDFVNAGPEFDLFILAFQRMQVRQQSDPLSYFGIAGIHGYPRQGWDGVDGDGRYSGFCAHAAVIFPTWHRAYLTLFEQMISQHAQTIAELYPPDRRNMYRDAAQNVRLPYWDWAVHAALPEVTTQPNIIVDTPEGRQSIRNPLYEYVFHPGPQGNGFPAGHPLSNLTATTRYFDRATGQRNDSAATAVLLANAANTLTMTYQLLSSITDYTAMSCTFPGGVPNRQVNLESIHNYIHNFIGGYYGHMFWPELSAFDPIFWLHHANVDRLFAIWQTLNPNAYIVPTTNKFGTYAVRPGSIDSGSSGLMPFHMDEGSTMFTSDELRDITRLGYTYPELEETRLSEPDRMAYIRRQVNAMYAPNPEPSTDSTAGADKRSTGHFPGVSLKLAKQLAVNNALTQWSVAIQVDQASFDTSYSLDFFMGPPPTVAERSTAPNLVATYGQFVTDRSCDTEFEQLPSRLLSGEVALTHVLSAAVTRGDIYDLSPASVLPVLQEQLSWAARTSEDQEIDLSQLRGLEIVVQSREVTPRSADCEFPVYGAVTIHPEAVQNKLGASRFFKEEQRHRLPGQGMKSMWPRNQTK